MYVAGAWMRRSDDLQDVRVDNCSCMIDTSAIHGGRMSRTQRGHKGAWRDFVPDESQALTSM
jgi:hypothetical protein